MSGWRDTEIGEFVQTISKTYKFGNREKIIFLNTGDILDGSFLVDHYSDVDSLPGQAKKSIQKGDILYSEIRPANKRYAFVDFESDEYVVSTKLMVLRVDETIAFPKFIYQYLTSNLIVKRLQYLAESRSGTFPQITFSEISELPISLPTLEEQIEIFSTIDNLDQKITLLRQQNQTLEELAQTLFKRWFVEFEFPNENGEPYKSSGGKMEESELGEIPEGWRVGTLGEIIINHDSKRIPLSSNQRLKRQGIYPYHGATSIMDYVDDYIFDGRFLLLGEDGTVVDDKGYPILQFVDGKIWVNNHAHVLEGKNPFTTNYIFLLLKRTRVSQIVTGAVQLKINQGNLNSLEVLIPKRDIVESFELNTEALINKMFSNNKEIQSLTQLRDTLLPKLMSGELRVTV